MGISDLELQAARGSCTQKTCGVWPMKIGSATGADEMSRLDQFRAGPASTLPCGGWLWHDGHPS